jgi:MAF protein
MSDRSDGNGGNLTGGKLLHQATLEQHTRQSDLVLASASPRRAELMAGMGLDFRVSPAGINEDPLPGEPAEELVQRLAWAKAWSVAIGLSQGLVVGADSLVVLGGEVFGKPDGPTQAREMLRRLRGVRHRVVTGVAVIDAAGGRALAECMSSSITLRDLSDAEIARSIDSGVPFDKAGAYAVQDQELRPAESWEGCYSNIVGLPLCRLSEMLENLGFRLPTRDAMRAPQGCTGQCPFIPGETP